MFASRITTALVIAATAIGAGGVVSGCGTKDIPGVSSAKKQAQKALDGAQKQLDEAKKKVDEVPDAQRKQAQDAVDQAQKALDSAQKQLDTLG